MPGVPNNQPKTSFRNVDKLLQSLKIRGVLFNKVGAI